jgi:hypothetical protein
MKKILTYIFFFVLCESAFAQQNMDYTSFALASDKTNKKGMMVLTTFAAVNIIGSSIGLGITQSKTESHYFHSMNVAWNVFDLGLGIGGMLTKKNSLCESSEIGLKKHLGKQKTFLFNWGVDLAYIAGGLYMTERSYRSDNPALWKGLGEGVIYNGACLFLFDGIMYGLNNRLTNKFLSGKPKLTILPNPSMPGLYVKMVF